MGSKRARPSGKSEEPVRKKSRTVGSTDALMLRLKIQRVRDDDFFVSISGKDLVTQLKEEILRVIRTGDPSEVVAEVTNLRLIYKGKVLVDANTIEFYKIQNEDTIQLVPFRRRSTTASAPAPGQGPGLGADGRQPEQEEAHQQQNGNQRAPITVVTFSTAAVVGGVPRFRGTERQNSRSWRQMMARSSQSIPLQTRPSNPLPSRMRSPSGPVTSRSLRRFRDLLRGMIRRVSSLERRGRNRQWTGNELAEHLSAFIGEAEVLRSDVLAETRSIPHAVFAATAEDGVFSVVESKEDEAAESSSGMVSRRDSSVASAIVAADPRPIANRLRSFDDMAFRVLPEALRPTLMRLENGPGLRGRFTSEIPNSPINVTLRAVVVDPVGQSNSPDPGEFWINSPTHQSENELPDAYQQNSDDASSDSPRDTSGDRPGNSAPEDLSPQPSSRRQTIPQVVMDFFGRYINGRP